MINFKYMQCSQQHIT